MMIRLYLRGRVLPLRGCDIGTGGTKARLIRTGIQDWEVQCRGLGPARPGVSRWPAGGDTALNLPGSPVRLGLGLVPSRDVDSRDEGLV